MNNQQTHGKESLSETDQLIGTIGQYHSKKKLFSHYEINKLKNDYN